MTFRPILRPGAPLLRRDATHLQIGTSPGVVINDRPGLVALLRLLDGVRDVGRLQELADDLIPDLDRPVAPVLAELRAAGAVVDGTARDEQVRRRAAHTVCFEVRSDPVGLVPAIRTILTSAGMTRLDADEPGLLVVVSYGEAPRAIFERPVLLGVDHLPVVIDEDRVRIGPFVRPGRTPCVGCHDHHRTDWDAAWPALLHQLGHGPAPVTPPALDALAMHAAAVEIAAEVLAHAAGTMPRTAARCLVVGPSHAERVLWPVAFHHRCACDLLSAA